MSSNTMGTPAVRPADPLRWWRRLVVALIIGFVVAVFSVVPRLDTFFGLKMDYVPTERQLRDIADMAPFVAQTQSLRGLYGNMDVTSVVFEYDVPESGRADFWGRLESAAKAAGWTALDQAGDVRRFEIHIPAGQGSKHGHASQVRVAFYPDRGLARVAWIWPSAWSPGTDFDSTESGRWAMRFLWPKLVVTP